MALPRFEKLPADRRHQVIAAAAAEFAAKGYTGAALGVIADESGMGKTSLYYYFADKADLYATVLEEAWRRLRADGRFDLEGLTAESFWSAYEALAREDLELCRREPWLLAASRLLNRTSPDPADEAVLAEYRRKRRAWEAAWIRRGQELGAVRDDVPADLLVTMSFAVGQAANLWLLEREQELGVEGSARLALRTLEIHRSLLSPPPRGGHRRPGEGDEPRDA